MDMEIVFDNIQHKLMIKMISILRILNQLIKKQKCTVNNILVNEKQMLFSLILKAKQELLILFPLPNTI